MIPPCTAPLDDDALLAWWVGDGAPPLARRTEEHLLACDACAARARTLHELAAAVSALVRSGDAAVAVVPSVVDRLRREGRRIREYALPPGGRVACTVAPDDEVLVARLRADLRGVERVDVVSTIDGGPERRVPSVSFDPAAGEVVLLPPITAIRGRAACVERMALVAVSTDGGERRLGDYEFDHTPWPSARG